MTLPVISALVPHRGSMSLLDRVLSADSESMCAEVAIHATSMFCDGASVGAWIGIEYMAQAVAAHAGYCASLRGEPVKVGFLLGTRRYDCACAGFAVGTVLQVHVRSELQGENGLGAFECRIDDQHGATLASATVTVYQPANVEEFLQRSSNE
jgi:predicted hotdog family 3-hydroxylacyl-ACP dehydratase